MNMCWILLLFIFMVWSTNIRRKKSTKNLIVIQTSDSHTRSRPRISYSADQLTNLHDQWAGKNKHRRSTPNYATIRRIKQLKINRRRIRLQRKDLLEQRQVNLNNLTNIHFEETSYLSDVRLKFSMVNARSIRNKITRSKCARLSCHVNNIPD